MKFNYFKKVITVIIITIVTCLLATSCTPDVELTESGTENGYVWVSPGDTYLFTYLATWGKATLTINNETNSWIAASTQNLNQILSEGYLYQSYFNVMKDSTTPGISVPSAQTVICNIWNMGFGYNMTWEWGSTTLSVTLSED